MRANCGPELQELRQQQLPQETGGTGLRADKKIYRRFVPIPERPPRANPLVTKYQCETAQTPRYFKPFTKSLSSFGHDSIKTIAGGFNERQPCKQE